jgi:hypothetical protein
MIQEPNDNTPTIETVERQFEQWRSSRGKKREPIPQHLWQAAAQLCEIHPITHVCRRLRLSFPDLKKRLLPAKPVPQFVELSTNCLLGKWQLVCERPDGTRLHFSGGGNAPDVQAVIRQFFS